MGVLDPHHANSMLAPSLSVAPCEFQAHPVEKKKKVLFKPQTGHVSEVFNLGFQWFHHIWRHGFQPVFFFSVFHPKKMDEMDD